jgi:hypothetical protein
MSKPTSAVNWCSSCYKQKTFTHQCNLTVGLTRSDYSLVSFSDTLSSDTILIIICYLTVEYAILCPPNLGGCYVHVPPTQFSRFKHCDYVVFLVCSEVGGMCTHYKFGTITYKVTGIVF